MPPENPVNQTYPPHMPPDLVWRTVETAPEYPIEPYLAIDALGYLHVTQHERATLMHAGWAVGWHPMQTTLVPDNSTIYAGGMAIAAMHAREFRRLLTAHNAPVGTIIEGVTLVTQEN